MIRFEKFKQDDFENYYRLVTNFNTMDRLGKLVYSRDEALIKFLQLLDQEVYRIFDGDKELGLAKLLITNHEGQIGYLLLPEYWKLGYGQLIVAKLVALARVHDLDLIYDLIDPSDELLYQAMCENGFVIVEPEMSDGQAKIRLELKL